MILKSAKNAAKLRNLTLLTVDGVSNLARSLNLIHFAARSNLTRFIKLKFDKIARHFIKGEKMKNLVLAAIAALFFAGCAANKPAPAEQNAQEYRHATQIKDASCPHHGMTNASCAQAHGAMKECPHHGNHGADKSGASDKAHACPHHKH